MKVRRPEFKRARKIRQRARKRWPLDRSLKMIYTATQFVLLTSVAVDYFEAAEEDRSGGRMFGGRYIETTHYWD